jgi:hypothetical protein
MKKLSSNNFIADKFCGNKLDSYAIRILGASKWYVE